MYLRIPQKFTVTDKSHFCGICPFSDLEFDLDTKLVRIYESKISRFEQIEEPKLWCIELHYKYNFIAKYHTKTPHHYSSTNFLPQYSSTCCSTVVWRSESDSWWSLVPAAAKSDNSAGAMLGQRHIRGPSIEPQFCQQQVLSRARFAAYWHWLLDMTMSLTCWLKLTGDEMAV